MRLYVPHMRRREPLKWMARGKIGSLAIEAETGRMGSLALSVEKKRGG